MVRQPRPHDDAGDGLLLRLAVIPFVACCLSHGLLFVEYGTFHVSLGVEAVAQPCIMRSKFSVACCIGNSMFLCARHIV